MLICRGTTAKKAPQRGPIVAVLHDQKGTDAIGGSSWVFIAESGAKTRLVLPPRNRRTRVSS